MNNIGKLVNFAEVIKEALFAYFDVQQIGMIDYQSFVQQLTRTNFKHSLVTEDSWQWQTMIIDRIKNWFERESLSEEDAFRAIDKDFDGFISKQDLIAFLTEVLGQNAGSISDQNIDRLFKLMDQFKRGQVDLNDFKRLLYEDLFHGSNEIIQSQTQQQQTRSNDYQSSFNWKPNAIQQIGLVLSIKFPSLQVSFDEISNHSKRLVYSQFKKWVEESRAISGFVLTEKLIQQIFSSLDPHKKGFLSFQDWSNAFGGFNWSKQMVRECFEAITHYFANAQEAINFFKRFHKTVKTQISIDSRRNSYQSQIISRPINNSITFEAFNSGIQSLFPNRFSIEEINQIWRQITQGEEELTEEAFQANFLGKNSNYNRQLLGKLRKNASTSKLVSNKRLSSKQNQTFSQSWKSLIYDPSKHSKPSANYFLQSSQQFLEQIRVLLRTTNTNLEELFMEKDPNNTGILTFLDFKNQLRKLNLGVSNKSLDLISQFCNVDSKGFINWRNFIAKVQMKNINQRIMERSKTRLEQFRNDMYAFMLSPKEAFRQFNTEQNGKLTFNQFMKLIEELCTLSNQTAMPYQIIKDLFDLIDIRKDGVIDMKEWLHSLKVPECLNKTAGTNPRLVCNNAEQKGPLMRDSKLKTLNNLFSSRIYYSEKKRPSYPSNNDPTRSYFVNSIGWEMETNHDKMISLLGRNRRALADAFKTIEITEGRVTKEKCVQLMQELVYSQGQDYKKFNWWSFVKAAERDGIFDYNFFLGILKERCNKLITHPKQQDE